MMDFRHYTTLPHPTAFAGLNQLRRFYPRLSYRKLADALTTVHSYTRNREVKKPVYNPLFVRQPRRLLQADLLDKSKMKTRNAYIPYWLVVIDTFTRYVWMRPLKSKTTERTADAFQSILDEMTDSDRVRLLLTDQGTEFTGSAFQRLLRRRGIKHVTPLFHAPHVERFNRTIQNIIGKYLIEYSTARFVDIADMAVQSYNSRRHRAIKMSPLEAEKKENQDRVRLANEMYYRDKIYKGWDNKKRKIKRARRNVVKFKKNELVRKVVKRSKFFRSFHPTFAEEVFKIADVHTNLPTTLYTLQDMNGRRLKKKFYPRELQRVSDLSSFKIAHIYENTRRRNPNTGEEEVKVSFEGLPSRYKTFVSVDSIQRRT